MQPLVHNDLLQTLTEVSAAFVGFSMLANMLQRRTGGDLFRFFGYRDVAEIGLIGVLGSLAPLLLHSFGWPEETVWRWSSAIFGAIHIAGATAAGRRRRAIDDGRVFRETFRAIPISAGMLFLLLAVVVALAITNAFAPGPASAARHVSAVAISLGVAGWMFLLTTFVVGVGDSDSTAE